MELRQFGWTGVSLPVIGQGTWKMEWDDRATAVEALRRGLDAGATHVDTAELYGGGRVEELVGEALRGRRDGVFLASKVLPQNASRRGTIAACERSLRRLGTDRLDLYLLHWPGPHPLAETFAAFEELVDAGKIRFWGVSNFDADELEEAVALAGEDRIACDQVLYHPGERAAEHEVIPACERHRIAVVAYSPFGSGALPSNPVLRELAREHGATERQVALRFLVRRPSVVAIPKAADPRHAVENAAAGDLSLTDRDLARLDVAFPRGAPPDELPVL